MSGVDNSQQNLSLDGKIVFYALGLDANDANKARQRLKRKGVFEVEMTCEHAGFRRFMMGDSASPDAARPVLLQGGVGAV